MKKKVIIAVIAVVVIAALAVGLWQITSGKGPAASGDLTVTRIEFSPNTDLIDIYTADRTLINDAFAEAYDLDIVSKNDFYAAPEEWLAYNLTLNATNNSDSDITICGFDIPGNGRNKIFICNTLDGGVSLSPGASTAINVTALCGNGDLADIEFDRYVTEVVASAIYVYGSLDGVQTVSDAEAMTVYIGA